jgi:tetratricopeptide (TPR) repeat protein
MLKLEQELAKAMQCINTGKIDEAGKIAEALIEEFPVEPQVLHVSGLVEFKKGNLKLAISAMEKATQISKNSPLILGNLAEAYRRNNEYEQALKTFEHSLIVMPEFLKGHLGVANVLKDMKRYPEAISKFRLVLAINANFAPAYHYLGVLYHEIERTKDAIPLVRKAVSISKGHYLEAQITLAGLLEWDGQTEKALALYMKMLEIMPKNPMLLNSIGTILRNLGRMDESLEYYTKAKEINPNQSGGYFSSVQTDDKNSADDIAHMEKTLENKDIDPGHRCSLHMTLGKVYDDAGNYEKAFENFKMGNDLDKRDRLYDDQQHKLLVRRVKETFSAEFFRNNRGIGCDDEAPVFVCGVPRSGTTLSEQTLASHPDVFGAGELTLISKQINAFQEKPGQMAAYPESVNMLDPVRACEKIPSNPLYSGYYAV